MPSNEDYPHVGDTVPTVASTPTHQFGTAGGLVRYRPPTYHSAPFNQERIDRATKRAEDAAALSAELQKHPFFAGEVRVTDPETGGAKGTKPERYDLVPWEAMDEVARVYEFGSRKYDDHNWRKGYKWSLSIAAAFRHLARFVCGETHDPESGLHHCAHATFHMLTLITYTMKGLGTDDRPGSQ